MAITSPVLICATLLLTLATSNPIPQPPAASGAGHTDEGVIDCTLPLVPMTTIDNLKAGLEVLKTYSTYKLGSLTDTMYLSLFYPLGNCATPVSFFDAITRGKTTQPTTAHIAKWYTVFASFEQYLQTLTPTTSETETLITVLSAVNDEFFKVLQDLKCNCSSAGGCTIAQPQYKPIPDSCLLPRSYVENILAYHVIPQAVLTVRQFKNACQCAGSSDIGTAPDPDLAWFNEYFPRDDTALFKDMKKILQ